MRFWIYWLDWLKSTDRKPFKNSLAEKIVMPPNFLKATKISACYVDICAGNIKCNNGGKWRIIFYESGVWCRVEWWQMDDLTWLCEKLHIPCFFHWKSMVCVIFWKTRWRVPPYQTKMHNIFGQDAAWIQP